jgi:hypothetical protein
MKLAKPCSQIWRPPHKSEPFSFPKKIITIIILVINRRKEREKEKEHTHTPSPRKFGAEEIDLLKPLGFVCITVQRMHVSLCPPPNEKLDSHSFSIEGRCLLRIRLDSQPTPHYS